MKKQDLLERIGLTGHQSEIYLALVEMGPSKISQIAKHTGLHRPTIYQALHELDNSGLITTAPRGKQTLYIAEPPDKLTPLLEQLSQNFSAVLPLLKQTYITRSKRPIVKFLEGAKGITFVYDDIARTLKRGDVFYRFSSRKDTTRGDRYLPASYRQRRDQKQLQRFVITNLPLSREKKSKLERAVKVIPPKYGLFQYDITELIYGDKVAFVDYNTETAFIVENPLIAEFQRKIFKIIYDLI